MDLGIPGIEIGERISRDAIAECYAASEAGARRTLRVLRSDLEGRDDARLLFAEEMRRVGRIAHPALLAVHRAETGGARPWMLTDPIDGDTLARYLESRGPLDPAGAMALAETLASAFAYLEDRRQVHAAPVPTRLVRVDEAWRLVTFRDIRAWDELKSLKGKRYPQPEFAPPERARDHPDRLSPHPFLAWALGALLRFAAGGGPPAAAAHGLPAALAGPVARLTDPEPGRRPQGARALAAALTGEGGGATAPRPAIKAPVPRRRKRRR